MRIFGISALSHDAAITVVEDDEIVFAAHAERYSRVKFDKYLNDDIVNEALAYGEPDKIIWYERPWLKKSRQLYAHQWDEVFTIKNLPRIYLNRWFDVSKLGYVSHHRSHAQAAYYTSPFVSASVIVVDAIGEWDVATLWRGEDNKLEKIWSRKYPHSLGLYYSAMTRHIGLKPNEEEYIMMGMAAYGNEEKSYPTWDFFNYGKTTTNLHQGLGNWKYISEKNGGEQWKFDLARNVQRVLERELRSIFWDAQDKCYASNIVFTGGVALNCVSNSVLRQGEPSHYSFWIPPNPGDAGSSLGAALNQHVHWRGPYLGTTINGPYPTEHILKELLDGNIVGVANGRAEFGPRALGNRSLLADPRGGDTKDRINKIKHRQEFRPFAPAILEEYASTIFDMPQAQTPYMQYVAKCKEPNKYPAICHVDGTSRVQTVSASDHPEFYNLIKKFYEKTGCPMLLNTSLNIKGQPIVNTELEGQEFAKKYKVKVFS